jgi:hypothetical protein
MHHNRTILQTQRRKYQTLKLQSSVTEWYAALSLSTCLDLQGAALDLSHDIALEH